MEAPAPTPAPPSLKSLQPPTSPGLQLKQPRPFKHAAPRRELALTFSALAWIKLQFLCHLGDTEIGAFAISSASDPLYVEDLVMVQQTCSNVSVEFGDEAVADYFDAQIDAGRRPEQFGRIWLHTHPGSSPQPSGTDVETFQRVFGRCDWAIMFILARGGRTFCRLRIRTPTTGNTCIASALEVAVEIPVHVDYASIGNVQTIDAEAWMAEYAMNVRPEAILLGSLFDGSALGEDRRSWNGTVEGRQERTSRSARPSVDDEEDAYLDMLIDQWEDGELDLLGLGGLT